MNNNHKISIFALCAMFAVAIAANAATVPVRVSEPACVSIIPPSTAVGAVGVTGESVSVPSGGTNGHKTFEITLGDYDPAGCVASVRHGSVASRRAAVAPASVRLGRGHVALSLDAREFDNASMSLYTVSGRRVFGKNLSSRNTSHIVTRENLSAGVYVLSVRGARGREFASRMTHGGGRLTVSAVYVNDRGEALARGAAGQASSAPWTIVAWANGSGGVCAASPPSSAITRSVCVSAGENAEQVFDFSAGGDAPYVGSRSPKRGVGYGFNAYHGGTPADMPFLSPGVSWFYNWTNNISSDIENAAARERVAYVPMVWNAAYTQSQLNALSALIARSDPKIEYILAYNEPMFYDQARMTPQEAAADWPRLKKFAADNGLKIIGPALNFGSYYDGVPEGRHDPMGWFETFLEQPEVELEDMAGIAIHCYMNFPGANKWFTSWEFRKFGLPIWVTEFCAWDWGYPNTTDPQTREWQQKYMSEVVAYYEQDPMIAAYAWFMPRGSADVWPYYDLIGGSGSDIRLTDLGKVYVNMSACDTKKWSPPGVAIPASDFNRNHLSLTEFQNNNKWFEPAESNRWDDFYSNGGYGGSVHFRPTTDTEANGADLEVYNFTRNKWQEYQFELPSAKDYVLTLRYKTAAPTSVDVLIDGVVAKAVTLNSAVWTTTTVDLGMMSAGKHTVRLNVNSGNCTLSWLMVL